MIQVITPVPPNGLSLPTDWLPTGEGYAWRLGKPVKLRGYDERVQIATLIGGR